MKKETKKKVFNFSLATVIVASVATPLAIVLGKESNLLFRKNTRETTNNEQFIDTSYINGGDYTLDLTNALSNIFPNNNDRSIRIANPNIAKAIPGGYVVVSGDSNNKNQQVVCLDSNNPTKRKWVINLGNNNTTTNINVYGIEYSPHSGGTLVVLYSEDANDQQYENDRINNQLRLKIFKDIDNKVLGNNLTHSSDLMFSYPNGSSDGSQAHIGGRLDTWAISPVYNFSGQVTKFIIYCKERNFTYTNDKNPAYFLLIDLEKQNNITNVLKIHWNDENGNLSSQQRKGILSTAAFEKDNTLYIAPLIINFETKKFKLDVYKKLESNEFHSHSKRDLNWAVGDHEIGDSHNSQIAEMVKGAISSFSFKKTSNGLNISFAINSRPNGNRVGKHRSSGIVLLELNNSFEITNTYTKDLFASGSFTNTDIKNELWTGYFSNEVIAKYGIDATLNKDYLTPFIGLGWSEVEQFGNNQNQKAWFIQLIKNPFNTNNSYEIASNTNSNDFRVYRINNDDFYKNWGGWNWGQFGFEQLRSGVPILEYNASQDKDESFNRNIFLTKNKTSKAIVINQKDRGPQTDSVASYSYHTTLDRIESSYSNLKLDKSMDNITEEKIISLVSNKEDIVLNFIGRNIVSDATFAISNIAFNYVDGTITFNLGITKYFDEKGVFQSGTKTFNLTINGFDKKETKINAIINLNNELHNNNVYSYHLIPSINFSVTFNCIY